MKAFDCKMCGNCCFGEGGIALENDDISRIADFLGWTREVFLSTRCYSRNGRVYIVTGSDGFCAFYDRDRRCTIHPVKPRPCSLWPYYPALLKDRKNWEEARAACPGINPECPFEEFVRQSGT